MEHYIKQLVGTYQDTHCCYTKNLKFWAMFVQNEKENGGKDKRSEWEWLTDSGLPMILATALVASLRMSEATTESTGTFVNRFNVGICFFNSLLLLLMKTMMMDDTEVWGWSENVCVKWTSGVRHWGRDEDNNFNKHTNVVSSNRYYNVLSFVDFWILCTQHLRLIFTYLFFIFLFFENSLIFLGV